MQQALAGTPDQWYTMPAGLHQIGDNYFLPGTENVRSTVLGWPTCRFGSYNPYNLTYADTLVDGVPCTLAARAAAPAPKPAPPAQAPTPKPVNSH